MTDDEKREKMAAEERKHELQSVSDRYLWELMGVTERRLAEIREEYHRRHPVPQRNKLIDIPCTLAELETAIHTYGDHEGFHGKVDIVLDNLVDPEAYNYLSVYEGDGK